MSQMKAQVDKLLTNVSNAYMLQNLIGEQLLPSLPVQQDSGIIAGYGNAHIRLENSLVGGRGRARVVQPIVRKTDQTYLIEPHELQGEVTESDYRNVEQPFDAEKDETQGLTSLILTEKELMAKTAFTSASVITQNVTLSGSSKFSDYGNSNPIAVFKNAQNAVLDGCGMSPNAAVMSRKLFNTLKYHPQILENLGFKQERAGTLSVEEIAKAMNVSKLFIGEAAYNSAKEGQADAFSQIWGADLTFFVRPDSPAKYQVSFGYMIQRAGVQSRRVKKWDIDETFGNKGILVGDYYQYRIVNANAAYLVKDAI